MATTITRDGTTAPTALPAALPTATAGPAAAAADRELAARDIAAFLQDRQADLVFFFGLGQGHYAHALRERTTATIIVFEPRAEVLADAQCAGQPAAGVHVVGTLAGLMALAAGRADLLTCRIIAGAIPALRDAMPESFRRFVEAVRQARVDAEIRSATVTRSAATWLAHLAANLPEVAVMPPLDLLAGHFAGRPGILVGAGPSLDRNLDELRQVHAHAVICAVSTALPALARAGIVPELVVAIEGNDLSGHFADVPHLDQVTLLPGPHSHPAHFTVPVGRRLAIAPEGSVAGDWLHRGYGRHQLASGGSVACSGFAALHLLGCDPLVLVGMDLALTDGRTHAVGTEQATRRVRYEPEAGRVFHYFEDKDYPGYWQALTTLAWGGEGQVLTRPVFNSFRLWFEGAADTWARDRALINATEGGARIHGFEEMALAIWRRALGAAPATPARQIIDRAHDVAPPVDPAPLWREVAAELAIVKEAAAAAADADRLAARGLRDLTARRYAGLDALLAKLARAESRLGELTRATRLLNALVGERSLALARESAPPSGTDPAVSTAWSLRQSRRLSALVIDGAHGLEALFGSPTAQVASGANGQAPSPASGTAISRS